MRKTTVISIIVLTLSASFIWMPVGYVYADDSFEFRFAVLSDAHLDSDAPDNPEYFKLLNQSEDILRIAIAEINAMNQDDDISNDLDFVLFPGDMANSRWDEDLNLLWEILGDLEIPFFMVPGDWDFTPNYSPRMVNELYGYPHDNLCEHAMYENSALAGLRKYDYSVDFRDADGDIVHIIGMDNVLHFDGNRGSFEAEQIEWLRNDLECNQGKPTIIMQHCPVLAPYSDDASTDVDNVTWIPFTKKSEREGTCPFNAFAIDTPGKKDRAADKSEEFLNLVTEFDVPLVISGDFHLNKKIPYPMDNPECLITINPALVSYPCAYTVYEYRNDQITWETRRIEKYASMADEYEKASLESYNRVYEKFGASQYLFDIVKTMRIAWGNDEGEINDWFGYLDLK